MISGLPALSSENKTLAEQYTKRPAGECDASYWTDPALNSFKSEVKAHYITVQKHRCCYCGQRIPVEHHAVWDLEHIAHRSSYPQFMLELQNLAAACKDCNGSKHDKRIVKSSAIVKYPARSDAFSIVHPHFDNWDEHLVLHAGFIYRPLSEKGVETIVVCGLLRFCLSKISWAEIADDPSVLETASALADPSIDTPKAERLKLELLLRTQLNASQKLLAQPTAERKTS